jgi:hypothetical protein
MWDEPDDNAELRARAEATKRRQLVRVERLGRRWQHELAVEQTRKRRGGKG